MCGIAGIWAPDLPVNDTRVALQDAIARLRHRGPDDRGIWTNELGVALGQTRLSILDLSDKAHQPMVSHDGRYVLLYNGEVYNFKEIRAKLSALGHVFRGTGDTEVVLQAFREWGSDAVHEFVGMFAIALWDEQTRTLELVRDRVGVKPLHFGWDGKSLWFGSELKALRAFPHWRPEIDLQALGEFLQYGYIAGDRAIYKGIRKLRPGHRLILKPGQEPVIEQYWSVMGEDFGSEPKRVDDREAEARLEELLISAFKYRMVSDVPVGVFLSGGIDSSLLTALVAKHHDQPIHTFTIGFKEDSHDESRWAKKVAEHCGTVHTEHVLSANEARDIARDWGKLFDEPFGDDSGIPTLLVSRLAARDVKVVLSADGGDELFSGYSTYAAILDKSARLQSLPAWLRRAVGGEAALFDPLMAGGKLDRARAMLGNATPGGLLDLLSSYSRPESIRRLLGQYEPPRVTADAYPGAPIDQLSLWDFHHYLPEDILTKVDRTTMAVSIEGRDPLLDHRVAEYALRLPPHLRRGTLGAKHILKSILYRYVPRELVDRPKQGFANPLEDWLRGDLRGLVDEHLETQRIRNAGLMDSRLVEQMKQGFFAGNNNLTAAVWFVLAFEMWREQWG